MSFNGSGVFNINTAGQPVANGATIDATVFNDLTTDLAAGLTNAVTKDGQTTPTANIPMGGYKLTGLGIGTATTDAARVDNVNANVCEFRLTLTTGTPVTTSDVTGATTIYCSPYKGNHIALYDGTNWVMRTSAEFSLALGTLTSAKPYDVFCYDNSGTPTLEFLVWTDDTTRATALTLQNGVLSKTGAVTRRYLGTFYTTSTTQTEDSVAKRYLWNYYNRIPRLMRALEATNSWNYSTQTFRQANNSSANQLNFVCGVSEDIAQAELVVSASNTASGETLRVGIGLDSTSALATGCIAGWDHSTIGLSLSMFAKLRTYPGVGKHYLAWLEYSSAGGTTTWYGDNNAPTLQQSGIHGEIMG